MAKDFNGDVFELFDTCDDGSPPGPAPGPAANPATAPSSPPGAGDTAASLTAITGNGDLLGVTKAFVVYDRPQRHIMVYGPNRSGKTVTVHTALKAKFCRERRGNLDPCNGCVSCRTWESGGWERVGCYRNREGHHFRYSAVDGTNPSTFDQDLVCNYRDRACPLVLYIDEVSHPEFAKFIPRLIKPMTERPMTVIASGVRLGPRKDPVTGAKFPGLSKDFLYRFAAIVRTTAPALPDFLRWLRGEVTRRGLEADEPTLSLIIERAGSIPGQALRPVMKAELLRRPLTRGFVEEFRWEV